jgi:glycosyltransferase involved in cell wall biosynthesis
MLARAAKPGLARRSAIEAQSHGRLARSAADAAALAWVSSPVDRNLLASLGVSTVIAPNAVRTGPVRRRDDGRTILFVGSLGYEPNHEGLAWFLKSVWPLLPHRSGVRLKVIGGNAPAQLDRAMRRQGIESCGWLDNLSVHYATAAITIAPIRSGAGTRIKLLESAAHGVACVSTRFGAEGSGLVDGRDIWIADGPAQMARAIMEAMDRPGERSRRGMAARARIQRCNGHADAVNRLAMSFSGLLHTAGIKAPETS